MVLLLYVFISFFIISQSILGQVFNPVTPQRCNVWKNYIHADIYILYGLVQYRWIRHFCYSRPIRV